MVSLRRPRAGETGRGCVWRVTIGLASFSPFRWRDKARRVGKDVTAEDVRAAEALDVFTRMRFCLADGTLDFRHNGSVESAPKGAIPWFSQWAQRGGNGESRHVVFGHWAALGITQNASVCCVDSGCVWGGGLSALREDDTIVTQPAID